MKDLYIPTVVIPGYRVAFFDELRRQAHLLDWRLLLSAGDVYFDPGVRTHQDAHSHASPARNVYFFRRRFLWQRDIVGRALNSDLVVLELNPRIASSWIILAGRRALGRPTLLWGHALSRSAMSGKINLLRRMQLRWSAGAITYTESDSRLVSKQFADKLVGAASNATLSQKEVRLCETVGNNFLTIGRLAEDKRLELLIRAYAKAAQEEPGIGDLTIVGDGPVRERLMQLVKDLGLADRVQISDGTFSHHDLEELYARARFSVVPWYVGLNAIQSLSYGVPVIYPREAPHAPEVSVLDQENSITFQADSLESLADALLLAWSHREVWSSRQRRMSSSILQRHSLEGMAEGFLQVVDRVGQRLCEKKGRMAL